MLMGEIVPPATQLPADTHDTAVAVENSLSPSCSKPGKAIALLQPLVRFSAAAALGNKAEFVKQSETIMAASAIAALRRGISGPAFSARCRGGHPDVRNQKRYAFQSRNSIESRRHFMLRCALVLGSASARLNPRLTPKSAKRNHSRRLVRGESVCLCKAIRLGEKEVAEGLEADSHAVQSADHAMDGSPLPYCGRVDASPNGQMFRPNPQVVADARGAADDSPEVTCGLRP